MFYLSACPKCFDLHDVSSCDFPVTERKRSVYLLLIVDKK